MMNHQFGIYRAYSNANVTSSTIWTATQSSTSSSARLVVQGDRNLVIYTTTNTVLWSSNTWTGSSGGNPYCLQILDSGNLIWTDNTNGIVWQTNSAQTG